MVFYPVCDMGGDAVQLIRNKFVSVFDVYQKYRDYNVFMDEDFDVSTLVRAFSPLTNLCCAGRKNSFVVDSDLNLYKCTVHFDMKENKVGYISPNGDAFVDRHLHSKWYINENTNSACKKCFYAPCCCGGGCPHKRIIKESMDGKCGFYEWKQELGKFLPLLQHKYSFEIIEL